MNPGGLEPPLELLRERTEACTRRILAYLESLPGEPSHGLEAVSPAAELHPPLEGVPLETLLDSFFEGVSKSINTAGAGYFAYVPGGGLYDAALADYLACSTNRYVGMWGAAPALAQLELNVIRWLCHLQGYGDGAMGILTSGGSMANFYAVVCARVHCLPPDFLHGTLYASEMVHASVDKAARAAGFGSSSLRKVPVDASLRIDVAVLRRMVADDRARGLHPFLVVGSAGTVHSGAVDPFDELADLAKSEGLWLHADGAYGGFFYWTERGRAALRGLDRCDSMSLDPHKGLFLPYGTGCLLVRDGHTLRRAFAIDADYLQDLAEGVNFSDYSLELSRDFRGLRVWLPLKLHGVSAFREALDEKLDLARYAYERLRNHFEMLGEPQLSIVAFRCTDGGDERNMRLLQQVNDEKKVFLSGAIIGGKYTLRLCILSFRSHREQLDEALESLLRNAAKLDSEAPSGI